MRWHDDPAYLSAFNLETFIPKLMSWLHNLGFSYAY